MSSDRSPKGIILTNVRNALINQTSQPYPQIDSVDSVYKKSEEPLEIQFANEFMKLSGKFIFCEDHKELVQNLQILTQEKQWNHLFCWEHKLQDLFIKHNFKNCRIGKNLEKADAGITLCEALVARTGSIMLSSRQAAGRTLGIFPPVHIVVAYTQQLVPDIQEAMNIIKDKYEGNLPSMINLATGPSRTADIEKTLVLGAHGPKEVYVFLIDNPDL